MKLSIQPLSPLQLGFVLAVAAAVPLLFRDPNLSLVAAALLATAIPVCALPIVWHCRFTAAERPPLPFLPLVGLFYLVFFVLPGFFIAPGDWLIGAGPTGGIRFDRVSETAAATILLGSAAMIFGFEGARRWFEYHIPPLRLPGRVSPDWIRIIAWIGVVAHLTYYYVPVVRCLPSVGQGLGPIGFFAFGYLFIQAVRGQLLLIEKLALIIVILPAKLIFHISDGLFTSIAQLVILFFCLAIHFSKNFSAKSWLMLGLLSITIILIYPLKPAINAHFKTGGHSACGQWAEWTKQIFGVQIVSGPELGQSPYDYYSSPLAAASGVVSDAGQIIGRSETFRRYILPVFKRVSLTALLAHVEQRTPEPVPYWNGSSLLNVVTNLVPRVLWKDKPTEQLGQKFGHIYGVLVDDDLITSWNVPWLVEIFMNFGVVGTAIGMGLLGLFLAALQGIFNRPGMGDPEIAVGGTLLFPLFYQESNVSVMTGSLLSLSVLLLGSLYVALRLGQWLWPLASPREAEVA